MLLFLPLRKEPKVGGRRRPRASDRASAVCSRRPEGPLWASPPPWALPFTLGVTGSSERPPGPAVDASIRSQHRHPPQPPPSSPTARQQAPPSRRPDESVSLPEDLGACCPRPRLTSPDPCGAHGGSFMIGAQRRDHPEPLATLEPPGPCLPPHFPLPSRPGALLPRGQIRLLPAGVRGASAGQRVHPRPGLRGSNTQAGSVFLEDSACTWHICKAAQPDFTDSSRPRPGSPTLEVGKLRPGGGGARLPQPCPAPGRLSRWGVTRDPRAGGKGQDTQNLAAPWGWSCVKFAKELKISKAFFISEQTE